MSLKSLKKDQDQQIIADVRKLTERLGSICDRLEGKDRATEMSAEVAELKRTLTDQQIEWDREKEKWDREKRETEHFVGLQRKRADQERELASREARLAVREENLGSKEDAFEERLTRVTEQLEKQIEYLRTDIISQILKRLPTFNVETALDPHRLLTPGNGNGGD